VSASPLDAHVHRFIPGERPNGPVLLALHGTGGDENDLVALARLVDPTAAILSPRGTVLESGMPRFFRRIAEGVFDEADLRRRTGTLADFVEAAAVRYGFERERLMALGYSNGANIAASLLLLRPEALGAGAMLLRAMLPLEPGPKDPAGETLTGRAVWIGAGRSDPYARPDAVRRLADVLKQRGAEVTVAWSEGGHAIEAAEIESGRRWLEERRAARRR
jgi:phospholipase/carboxylesterase/glyoxalase family protein